MIPNYSLFVKDPRQTALPNEGVAQVIQPTTPQQWEVLQYELRSFVCEGQYEKGLERILSAYLDQMGRGAQSPVWVSGFYGSGKSHLVRVLEWLWRNPTLPDGATARSLVGLPPGIDALLRELDTRGRQEGGLWSAAGKLSSGAAGDVRGAVMGVVLRSAGLPAQIAQARLAIWLLQEGYYPDVEAILRSEGRSLDRELAHMYVSTSLVGAIRRVFPGFAPDDAAGKEAINAQWPVQKELTTGDVAGLLRDVMATQSERPGKLPCTLLVLDEVQQTIGESSERTLQVQEAVEACMSGFGGRVLCVATGQAALQDTVQLQKLMGRFTVRVALSDADVENVVRRVILEKKAAGQADLIGALDACSGEISRHLVGSRIGAESADAEFLTADYPILPVRRRFWERVLRAIDRAGASGQLRSQLRVVYEAARAVADRPLGTVVGAHLIFEQQRQAMLQSGALLREVDERLQKLRREPDRELPFRLCACLFLIQQLDSDLGVRATADTLADLLVEDLSAGSAALRQRVPEVLKQLVDAGELLRIQETYAIQTREGQEWEREYKGRYARVFNDDMALATDRTARLREKMAALLKGVPSTHGQSKAARKYDLHFGSDAPPAGSSVPIWVRDEWSVSEKAAREEARAAGLSSPTVFVFVPKKSADSLRDHLAGFAAAKAAIEAKGQPATPEGLDARRSMESRRDGHAGAAAELVDEMLREARVVQGGGADVIADSTRDAIAAAVLASLDRLYPEFGPADSVRWSTVLTRARQGGEGDLSPVGWTGEPAKHPVCQELLKLAGATGKRGTDIRNRLSEPPYGWPQDAIDGGLLALVACGALRATLNGAPAAASSLDQSRLRLAEFRSEQRMVTALERIEVRKLLQDAGLQPKAGEEAPALGGYLMALKDRADRAGGPPPLPERPDTGHLDELLGQTGNDLIAGVCDLKERLRAEWTAWGAQSDLAEARRPRWDTLLKLRRQAEGLPIQADVAPQIQAIRDSRLLLRNPDPMAPLLQALEAALRAALTHARERHLEAYEANLRDLLDNPDWKQLGPPQQAAIRQQNGLVALEPLIAGTAQDLLAALDATPLSAWDSRTAALSERVAAALHAAAQSLEPKAERVTLPHDTLRSPAELDAYLERVRETVLPHLAAGRPVVV